MQKPTGEQKTFQKTPNASLLIFLFLSPIHNLRLNGYTAYAVVSKLLGDAIIILVIVPLTSSLNLSWVGSCALPPYSVLWKQVQLGSEASAGIIRACKKGGNEENIEELT